MDKDLTPGEDRDLTELVFNESRLPVIRAGGQNVLILMLVVYFLLTTALLKYGAFDTGLVYLVAILFGLIIPIIVLRRYSSFVSRIEIQETNMVLMCSLNVVIIPFEQIEYVEFRERSKGMAIMQVQQKNRSYSRRFLLPFVFVESNTMTKQMSELKRSLIHKKILVK